MSEKSLTNRILKYLNSLPRCKAIKYHGSQYGRRGTPDIICVREGQAIFLEVKSPGKESTDVQKSEQRRWGAAGAVVIVVRTYEEMLIMLGHWEGLGAFKPMLGKYDTT